MRVLHIDTSIHGGGSVSRELSAAIVERLRTNADIEVIYHDLISEDPPHLTIATLPWDHPVSARAGELHPAAKAIRDASQETLDEFVASDTVVIGVAMYNFTVASQLKAWIDRIVVPGRTFRNGAQGPEGLCADKRVILAVARGSVYGVDTFPASYEHAETYMRTVFDFIGIATPEIVVAEGTVTGADNRTRAVESAHSAIDKLAA